MRILMLTLIAILSVFLMSSVAWSGNESSAAYEQNEGYHNKAEYGEDHGDGHHGHGDKGLKCDCGKEKQHCRGHKKGCKGHMGEHKGKHKGLKCDCKKHGKKHQHHHGGDDGDLEQLFK